ncbi:MAG: DUF362 domain-containing protein [archaeon]
MDVSIVKCNSYGQEEVDEAVFKVLELIKFQEKPKKVLLKPNVLRYKNGVNTDISLLVALIKFFKDSEIYIGESSGYLTEKNLKDMGLYELGVKIINFDAAEKKKLEGKYLNGVFVPNIIFEMDLIVSVAKLKTHNLMKYTGCVKNLFGFVVGGQKCKMHGVANTEDKFADMLIEMHDLIKPQLALIDAVEGMEGDGPAAGDIIKVGYIGASRSCFALDNVMCNMIGIEDVKTNVRDRDVKVIGEYEKIKFKRARGANIPNSIKQKLIGFILKKDVKIDKEKCQKCNICRNHCPVDAIDENYNIDYKKCIRCFCCHELCPHYSVKIVKPKLVSVFIKIKKSLKM